MYASHAWSHHGLSAGMASVKLLTSPPSASTKARIRPAVMTYLSSSGESPPSSGKDVQQLSKMPFGSPSGPGPQVSPPWCCVQLGATAQWPE